MTHDYTRKGGIVHAEIMLPVHAPPEFADRSILWNSVEQIEKARDSQLAREIEVALPHELSGEQQLVLVRAYVKVMLTLRPLTENGQRGPSTPIGRWKLPADQSALTTAATSFRALIKFSLSIWSRPPAKWKSAASSLCSSFMKKSLI